VVSSVYRSTNYGVMQRNC